MDIPPFVDKELPIVRYQSKGSTFVATAKSEVVPRYHLSLELNNQYVALVPNMYVHGRMVVRIDLDAKSTRV
jgi:hypothetical protein